ncbi:VCBS repeat-containing protein [Metabacillus sp. 84]|uniref:VCBS repeat-containing protein n=1 Tax=unclassified Metabacillus TaxID=2675274 RepID=UPI003CE81E0B
MHTSMYRSNGNQQEIVAFARKDVTGDRVPDNVYLTGKKTAGSPFVQNIALHVQNGRTGAVTNVPLRNNAGYDPALFLGDFTGNGVADILISINTGGSGAIMYHYVYSFINSHPRLLFDSDVYNERYLYTVDFQNQYKVKVVSKINNLTYIIDISQKDPEYLNEIYEADGRLKMPVTGFVNPLSGLYPVDFDSDGVYELLAYQKIAGRFNADSLGYMQNTLGWGADGFALQNQYTAIFGV